MGPLFTCLAGTGTQEGKAFFTCTYLGTLDGIDDSFIHPEGSRGFTA